MDYTGATDAEVQRVERRARQLGITVEEFGRRTCRTSIEALAALVRAEEARWAATAAELGMA